MRTWDDYKKTMKIEDPIFDLARSGNLENLQSALTKDNLNLKDGKGYSPLMLAAYNGNFEATEFLLEMGADPNSSDNSGSTILMGASFKGHLEIVKLLVEKGANPKATNPKNQTALQFAQMFGRTEVANFLNQNKRFVMSDQLSSWFTFIFPSRRSTNE